MIAKPAFDPWVAALGSQPKSADKRVSDAKQAAQQFEALLVRQFLANARSTSWLNDQQESESGWREIADDALAGYIVKAGGLGLTKQVESLLMQTQSSRNLSQPTQPRAREIPISLGPFNGLADSAVTQTRAVGGMTGPDL